MSWNVPDDWNAYWSYCGICNTRYHLSGSNPCDCVYCEDCNEPLKKHEREEEICATCKDIREEEETERIENEDVSNG